MLPPGPMTGTEPWFWSQAFGAENPAQNDAVVPEMICGALHVWPPSCETESTIGEPPYAPFCLSVKSDHVTITLPLPHAAIASLSLNVPTLPAEPEPAATLMLPDQVRPPSGECATRMSAFLKPGEPCPNPNPSDDMYALPAASNASPGS